MLKILRTAFAVVLLTSLPALGADPARVDDPEKFCAEVMNAISSGKPSDAANLIATKSQSGKFLSPMNRM